MTLIDPVPRFMVRPFFDAEYLRIRDTGRVTMEYCLGLTHISLFRGVRVMTL